MSNSRRAVTALVTLGLATVFLAASAVSADAAGSANLWPNGAAGNRANTEWRTSSYGAGLLTRRTLIKAFMNAGEVLMLGSSAIGQGTSDILVYNPGVVTGPVGTEAVPAPPGESFSCNAQRTAGGAPLFQGMIRSRIEELTGPDTIPSTIANAYVPCHYTALTKGIYDIAFLGPNGFTNDVDAAVAADVALASVNDFNATQASSVAAWDATVRTSLAAPTTTKTGRVFTYYLALFTAGNGRPVFPSVYPVTTDGFKYRVDLRGMDPNGWISYGNQLGFLDSDVKTPLYHDAVAANLGKPGQLTNIQGGVTFQLPSFPLFFEPPDASSIVALGIATTPTAPVMTSLSFAGNLGGNTSLVNTGGTFTYRSNVPGVYEIVISRNGVNFDPTLPSNRSLRGARPAGVQTVAWDGKDNSGAFFPVGSYSVHANFHAGEYHFPMIDVENDTVGGPTITLLNPPGGVCPALTGGCKSGFYDDRAYRTLNGSIVDSLNTVGNVLCGLNPPTTPASDPILGFATSSVQRSFGSSPGSNTNVPCTGSFGDAKGLDTWTYYTSGALTTPVNIVATASDIGVTKTASNPTPSVGTNVTFTITAHNTGPDAATALQVTDVLPGSLTFLSASATQGTYTKATGVWNVGPLAVGATATLQIIVRVNGTTSVTNTARRSSSSPTDPNPANDSASASVTGSTVPGLPNTGVAPVADLWPGAVALLLVISAGLAMRRRRSAPRRR